MYPGFHQVEFDGSRFSSGVYIYRLESGGFNIAKKFILMK
ncbi:MAG: T9SS type A sorting domain-containing protein [Acidobacteriota bacterium]